MFKKETHLETVLAIRACASVLPVDMLVASYTNDLHWNPFHNSSRNGVKKQVKKKCKDKATNMTFYLVLFL